MNAAVADKLKENHISTQAASGSAGVQAMMGRTLAARLPAEKVEAGEETEKEVGIDLEEEGIGEEEVMMAEGAGEAGAQGLFGGAMAGATAVGAPVAAVGGLAAVSSSLSVDANPQPDDIVFVPPPINIAKAESQGVNIGPSADGSVLLSAGQTDVGLLGGKEPVASISKLSLINPDAPLPSGVPITVDPATQTLGLDLGPLLRTDLALAVDSIPDAALQFALNGLSGDLALNELVKLDIPTSIGGMEIPLTDTLNDGLAQLSSALSPILEPLDGVLGNQAALDPLTNALGGAPIIGDVVGQLDSLAENGALPIGELPIPLPTDGFSLPETGTALDLVASAATTGISSLAAGQIPAADAISGLLPG